MRKAVIRVLATQLVLVCTVRAQGPTGAIAGVLTDPDGAVVPAAHVVITNKDTGLSRTSIASTDGSYSAAALPVGSYEVRAEAKGFKTLVRQAVLEAGSTTTVDLSLAVGDFTEHVTAEAASPQIHYDSHQIGGVVTHKQIEDLPLNGRSYLELAKLEPGVQPPTRTVANRTLVPVLGAPGVNVGGTRFTVDGGSVTSVGVGGSQMGFSQEVVQEFQVSTVNFDLSAGVADAGAINVVTRSGGNDLHGAAFYFFRDHKLAAYPVLDRGPAPRRQ